MSADTRPTCALGRVIDRLLKRDKINAMQCGLRSGISGETVCSWRRGHRTPNLVTLKLLAASFGFTGSQFVRLIELEEAK